MKTHILKLLLASWAIAWATPSMAKPNLIVIFIDDMGYGDIGPFGSTKNDTPHLDRMAKEGMKLTDFYVASPVCSPSRAALMTGSYPKRVGLAKGSGHIVLFPGDPHGLNPKEITIAEVLKNEGYATGCFGKWHLGDQPEFLPTSQGFDEYYGIPYSNDMWPGLKRWKFPHLPILRGTKVVDQVDDMDQQAELCRLFTEEAVKFIEKNKDGPFFVYLPHAFVHGPRKARPEFMAKAKTVEEAQVEEVDWSAGQILDAVRKAGIEKNTFVLFTSDNGGAGGLSSAPLRGGKGSAWEGGVREPTIAWWPGKVPAGSVCKEIASTMDLLPTFANWAGGKVPDDRVIDGRDVGDLFLGQVRRQDSARPVLLPSGRQLAGGSIRPMETLSQRPTLQLGRGPRRKKERSGQAPRCGEAPEGIHERVREGPQKELPSHRESQEPKNPGSPSRCRGRGRLYSDLMDRKTEKVETYRK